MKKQTIILTTDKNYILPTLALFNNLVANTSNQFVIEIWFSFDLSSKFKSKSEKLFRGINKNFKLFFFTQSPLNAPGYKYLTSAAWIRLQSFDQKREADSLLLYLDSDIYLLERWEEIFVQFPLNDLGLAAVKTNGHVNFEDKYPGKTIQDYYFNSGVLLLNQRWWIEKKLDQRWKSIIDHYEEFGFKRLDQDVLNYLIRDDYSLLANRFNCYPNDVTADSRIIHFAGLRKPWALFSHISGKDDKFLKKILFHYRNNLKITLLKIVVVSPVFSFRMYCAFIYRFTLMNLKNLFLMKRKKINF